jgi:hypothetical protein
MWPYLVKVAVTAAVVVTAAEIAKRSTRWGAALASLPLTSLLAFVWLYVDTGDTRRVADLSQGIFWLVLPSLLLFVVMALLLRSGSGFWSSLGLSCVVTAAAYVGMMWCLAKLGIGD